MYERIPQVFNSDSTQHTYINTKYENKKIGYKYFIVKYFKLVTT